MATVRMSGWVSDGTASHYQEAERVERSAMSNLGLESHQYGLYRSLRTLEERIMARLEERIARLEERTAKMESQVSSLPLCDGMDVVSYPAYAGGIFTVGLNAYLVDAWFYEHGVPPSQMVECLAITYASPLLNPEVARMHQIPEMHVHQRGLCGSLVTAGAGPLFRAGTQTAIRIVTPDPPRSRIPSGRRGQCVAWIPDAEIIGEQDEWCCGLVVGPHQDGWQKWVFVARAWPTAWTVFNRQDDGVAESLPAEDESSRGFSLYGDPLL